MGDKKPEKKSIFNIFKRDPNGIAGNRFTRLQNTIFKGDRLKVKDLLKAGANPDFTGVRGADYAPLSIAVTQYYTEIAEELLKAGADVHGHTAGKTYLTLAVMQRSTALVELLLAYQADPNKKDLWSDETPLFHVHDYDHALVNTLVRAGAKVDDLNYKGMTPLYHAVCQERYLLANRLLSCGADPNLHPEGSVPLIELLLENVRNAKDRLWPLAVDLIRKGADANALNSKNQSLFMLAVMFDDLKMARFAKSWCQNAATPDQSGNAPLHHAISLKNPAMIREVLDVYDRCPDVLPHTPNDHGDTPVKIALTDGFYTNAADSAVIGLLSRMFETGADINTQDDRGLTLLHWAVNNKNEALLDMCLSHKADADVRDHDGETPLTRAALANDLETVDTLLDHGADPSIANEKGWTILDRLSRRGDRTSPLVQRLLAAGGQYAKQLPANDHIHQPQAKRADGRALQTTGKGRAAPLPKKPPSGPR